MEIVNRMSSDHRGSLEQGLVSGAGVFGRLWSKPGLQLLLIMLAATVLGLPCLLCGIPNGYSSSIQVVYQHHFSRQFWNGDFYPRWLAEANGGYGSPIFLIQYPFPYFIATLLGKFTAFSALDREARDLGLFAFLVLAGSGIAVWFWLRKVASPRSATFAAIVYMCLPYVLGPSLYIRTSLGELCALLWMPLAFAFCESMHTRLRAVFQLSVVFALLILSNLLNAVIFALPLIAYAVVSGKARGVSARKSAALAVTAEAFGAGLSAVYLFPMLVHSRLFDLKQLSTTLPGYSFGLYFLYLTADSLTTRVVPIVLVETILFIAVTYWYGRRVPGRLGILIALVLGLGGLALVPELGTTVIRLSGFTLPPPELLPVRMLLTMFATAALGILCYSRVSADPKESRDGLLLTIACTSFLLMLPFSAPIWKVIPGLTAIQFPFRMSGILTVAVAGLVAAAFDSRGGNPNQFSKRPPMLVVVLATLVTISAGAFTWGTWRSFLYPATHRFDPTADLDTMYRTYVPPQQLKALATLLGTTPESFAVTPRRAANPPLGELVAGDCDMHVTRVAPRELSISGDCRQESRLRINQIYSPLWKVISRSGLPTAITVASADGLIELTLLPGRQEGSLVFDIGPSEVWGRFLSEAFLVIGLAAYLFSSVMERIRRSNSPRPRMVS